jgi:hypothetical protein
MFSLCYANAAIILLKRWHQYLRPHLLTVCVAEAHSEKQIHLFFRALEAEERTIVSDGNRVLISEALQ